MDAHKIDGFFELQLAFKAEDFPGTYASIQKSGQPLPEFLKNINGEADLVTMLVRKVTMMGDGDFEKGVKAFLSSGGSFLKNKLSNCFFISWLYS